MDTGFHIDSAALGSNAKHIAGHVGSTYSTILSAQRGGMYRNVSASRK
jgi:hypothetical protein